MLGLIISSTIFVSAFAFTLITAIPHVSPALSVSSKSVLQIPDNVLQESESVFGHPNGARGVLLKSDGRVVTGDVPEGNSRRQRKRASEAADARSCGVTANRDNGRCEGRTRVAASR